MLLATHREPAERNPAALHHRVSEQVICLTCAGLASEIVGSLEKDRVDGRGRSNFQLLQRRISVMDAAEMTRLSLAMPARYLVFDLLAFAGRDLRPLALERRKEILAKLVRGDAILRYCDHVVGRGREFYAAAAGAGLEGIIAKRRESKYAGRRTGDWLKIKCPRVSRFVIGGWTDPDGGRSHLGALLLGQYEEGGGLRFVSRVGTGFDDRMLGTLARRLAAIAREKPPFRPHLERPDWLLFDLDVKGSTPTARAVKVALEVGAVLREIGMTPYLKTSGQAGIHVVVGLAGAYTYEQARMFSEAVARLVVGRVPEAATRARDIGSRGDRAYIDYLQLGQGKTIAAPFAVRPIAGAPVSAPLKWDELRPDLEPRDFNVVTMPRRMALDPSDPFLGALDNPQRLEPALVKLEAALRGAPSGA